MIVNSVKPLVYYFKSKSFNIFDPVFKMHTKLTVYFLLICSFVISGHSWTGKPLDCLSNDKDRKAFAELICWANGTFTVHSHKGGRPVEERHYYHYYQWVVIILLVEAGLFSIPERLWKVWEHGRIQQLCTGLNSDVLVPDGDDYEKNKKRVVSYWKLKNSRIHGSYVFRYVCCEVMNFLCVVLNMFILNVVFDRFWSRYLPAVLSLFTTEGPTFSTLAAVIFPITAKCNYSDFGASGSEQLHDHLCLLTLNVVNEKVFAFLYIWYLLLLFVSGLNLIWRSLILLSPSLRLKIIQSSTKWTEQVSEKEVKKILAVDNIGDWFIMFLLGQNLNRFAFREILDELAERKELLNNDTV
ncbi:innexin inx5-like isoform X2 [Bradysia coprophila]|uniref:innexin inx5-like isoform X2 n=1 Tax=Bradysia coprophila TaxID=38358 RepID=UPI00187D97EE|nr:innexin inx5-like isoform X2 [Bradysia coprophila]